MINRQALLADLQKFLQRIEADLLERSESTEVPEVPAALHAEYEKAAEAERTAQNYEDWRTDTITQAAAAWVLSCVFVRFLEDNSLIDPPKIAGPGDRLARARDEHELYFRSYPQHTDREYLLSIFADLAKLPGARDIFGEHNAINDLPNWLSGDAAGELLNFFQKIEASTGDLVHDFTDPNWDTRFLGDLYQDLSEAARKKFALLQTPDFVEEFILERTLEPAIAEFGLLPQQLPNDPQSPTCFKMIDPACGSGHFLLGAFPRLLEHWQRKEPGTNIRELTQRSLNSIHGIDINPFAVAIAKFRLLLIAMRACEIRRLADAPAFHINVSCGDSLLHGENRTSSGQRLWDYAEGATDEELYSHSYPGEDLQAVRAILKAGTYHCVVANPPYIVPKDRKLSEWYRKRFSACHMQYSLAVPFMQQIFQLSVQQGFTGQITANSFMKREFGRKLIETFFPSVELTHVIDTSGAYIPGHGTPTTIVLGRNRTPISSSLRTVLGIRGEPETPSSPSQGVVWRSIKTLIDRPNSQDEFVSVSDSSRSIFCKHPWSIGGGGAAELKEMLDSNAESNLKSEIHSIGRTTVAGEDEAWILDNYPNAKRRGLATHTMGFVLGDMVRDWQPSVGIPIIYPYDHKTGALLEHLDDSLEKSLWPNRTLLKARSMFGKSVIEATGKWYPHLEHYHERVKSPLAISLSEMSTHNHFVLYGERRLFNKSAPILILKNGEAKPYFEILTVCNSSTVCFWMRQVAHNKGDSTDQHGARTIGDPAFNTFAFNCTMIGRIPLPKERDHFFSEQIVILSRKLDALKQEISSLSAPDIGASLKRVKSEAASVLAMMCGLQEEMDWKVYSLFGMTESSFITDKPPELKPGQRAFEIVLARRIAAGDAQSTWFERHGVRPLLELPEGWSEDYRKLVERRIELIESDPNIRLIEQPEYKRRWNTEPWELQLERSLREWLLLRLETYFDFDGRMTNEADVSKRPLPLREIAMYSIAQLADSARRDPQFMEVGELYRDDPAFDVQALVEELVLAESVPHLPILRYKDSGLRKRAEWEKTWDLQRREDAGEAVGTIPVPPKYTSADFISTGGARYWSLRGKLDVPKERWISFPHCEGPDGTLVICWAGYDHLQQAQAISAYYVRVQTEFGGSDDPRLIPLLASLIELLPWLKQWHNEPNANFDGLRMGDYFEGFVNEEARNLGKTLAEIKAWVPPARTTTRGRRKTT